MKKTGIIILAAVLAIGCNKPSRVEQYKQEKHLRDSAALVDQQRSLEYYQTQWDQLMPKVDSLLRYFKYEKNDKYQDHGYYIVKPYIFKGQHSELRVMVREDGAEMLVYREGKRLSDEKTGEWLVKGEPSVLCGKDLQVVITDAKELEKRFRQTSLVVQKYQKRLDRAATQKPKE